MEHRLSVERIAQASTTVDPVFLHTPQIVSEPMYDLLGIRLVTKIETLYPIHSI
jgi:threonine dehydratase